ncbi:hypothetical protein AB0L66_11430 [Streptomyces sp. NPDC052207]|uniref:hypothetical protein n=1 Tax=Streptomyces sp. NPDC052207 TaxID=3155418 RepID=UPI003444FCD6
MALSDIDLKYRSGVLTTTKNVAIGGTLSVGGASVVSGGWLPSDHGLISWSGDPSNATTSTATVNGSVYLVRLNIRYATTITKVWWCQIGGPTTPTAGQNFAGLYSSAGALLSSVNIDAKTGNGPQNATLDAAQAVSAGSFVWAAFMFNAATPPTLMKHGGGNAAANIANLTAATARWAVNGTTTGLTALPSSITPPSNSQTGVQAFWAALS